MDWNPLNCVLAKPAQVIPKAIQAKGRALISYLGPGALGFEHVPKSLMAYLS